MSSSNGAFEAVVVRPTKTIHNIIAVAVLVMGLYTALPFLTGGSAVALAFPGQNIVQSVVGVLIMGSSLPILAGWFIKKFDTQVWYSRSTFSMFVALMFLVLIRLILIGPLPIFWVPVLGLALVTGVCHLHWKAK